MKERSFSNQVCSLEVWADSGPFHRLACIHSKVTTSAAVGAIGNPQAATGPEATLDDLPD